MLEHERSPGSYRLVRQVVTRSESWRRLWVNRNPARPGPVACRQSGAALVIVLSLLVLCTIIVLAFLSQTLLARQTSASSANSMEAELLARAALNEVIATLQTEISAGSTSQTESGRTIYYPASAVSQTPVRSVSSAVAGNPTAFRSLLKQSAAGVSTYSGSDANYPAKSAWPAVIPGSTVSTATASPNGRLISPQRWNLPRLTFGSGFTSTNEVPHWVYLTRVGMLPQATDAEVALLSNSSPTNQSYAIGRYAYQVYDISGLLDANLAGHPSSLTAREVADLKGTLSGTILSAVPGLTTPQVLMNWRQGNLSPADFYTNQISNTNGFLATMPGMQRYLNRQDLLRFFATNANLGTEALPYLTVFNRKKNAPSFSYSATGLVTTNATNASPLRLRMASSGTSPLDNFSWQTGDPVVPRRFPLSRLDWLRFNGSRPDVSAEKIQAAFGLVWDNRVPNDANPASLNGDRWVYVGNAATPNPDQPATEIKTLQQVATEGREPNFFELLKAAIHRGSLGLGLAGTSAPDSDVLYGLHDLQILRIGASMIDQFDADSYPTLINMRVSDGSINPVVEVHGVENLPYISRLAPFYINPDWPNDPGPGSRRMQGFLVPEIWNPHQPLPVSGESPAALRIFYTGGHQLRTSSNLSLDRTTLFNLQSGSATIPQQNFSLFSEPRPLTESITTRSGVFANTVPFKDFPIASNDRIVGAELTLTGNLAVLPPPSAESPSGPFWNGYNFSDTEYNEFWIRERLGGGGGQYPLNAILQFQNYRGRYQNYNVFSGGFYTNDADLNSLLLGLHSGNTAANGFRKEEFPLPYLQNGPVGAYQTTAAPPLSNGSQEGVGLPTFSPDSWEDLLTIKRQGSQQIFKPDPRTARLGLARYNFNTRNASPSSPNFGRFTWPSQHSFAAGLRPVNSSPMNQGPIAAYPALSGYVDSNANLTLTGANSNQYRPAMFERNRTVDGAGGYYQDNDGVARPGDNANQDWSNSVYNQPQARPVVLNRPFRSVAELGYVFRDSPHKTLDLFSSESADAALLDFFCLNEAPTVVGGVVNLAAAPPQVLQSLLQGAARTPSADTLISAAEAASLGANLNTRLAALAPRFSADLVVGTATNTVSSALGGIYPGVKTRREGVIRSLASVHNERTWNLFIDVIAQVGKFPPNADSLNDFIVEGERRYWLHVAIDRYTGEVLEELKERVSE